MNHNKCVRNNKNYILHSIFITTSKTLYRINFIFILFVNSFAYNMALVLQTQFPASMANSRYFYN